ncbi:MAG: hypothetical protein QXR84_05090 [Candidatus Bathyarchaeia archaeon]
MSINFEVWFLPHNLKAAYERAATLLKSIDFNILYLHVPRELNWLINEIALGAPYEQFIEAVKKTNILRESIGSWEYRFKSILLAIRGLRLRRPNLKIICYRSSLSENLSTRNAEEIAKLILRVNITGKVDIEVWRNIVLSIINNVSSSADDESNYILKTFIESGCRQKAICLSDYPARRLVKRLREMGIKAFLRFIFTPYYFTPLEILIRESIAAMEKGLTISDERIESLVKTHAEFIRDYILTSDNYDEAYFKWLRAMRERFRLII